MKMNPNMAAREHTEHNSGKSFLRSLRSFAAIVVSLLFAGTTAHVQVNSGSDGHDGALNPTASITIDIADHPDGIYRCSSVSNPTSVEGMFIPNVNSVPPV
ncbi:MAG: hypothetical protein EXS31_06550 [Pedosphaera sp.]|nr:hypothetical protein [Pedosphaera sp.]